MIKGDLTQGPVMKTMLLFAVPMILGNLLQQCYNVADTLIVGRFLGPDALAAQMKNIVEYYRTGAAPQGHTYRWLTKEGMDTFIRRNACEIRPLLQGL